VSGTSSSNGIPSDTLTGQIAGQAVSGRATTRHRR
jgi:hypothetical protein